MKVSNQSTKTVANPRRVPPPVPLVSEDKEESKKPASGELQKLKLKVDPSREDSETYTIEVRSIDNPTPSSYITWRKAFDRVRNGLSLTTGQQLYAMARTLLRGRMLRTFNDAATQAGTETVPHFEQVLNSLSDEVFPLRALAKQKRYMRKYVRKPRDIDVRTYVGLLTEMNANLAFFPDASEDDKLKEDEMVEILESSMPSSWHQQMIIQGFDPAEHSLHDLMDFCERLQVSEQLFENAGESSKRGQRANRDGTSGNNTGGERSAKNGKTNRRSNKNNRKRSNENSGTTKKWCDLHEVDTHDTGECKVVMQQVKKMRDVWNTHKQYGEKRTKNPKGKSEYSSHNVSRKRERSRSRSRSPAKSHRSRSSSKSSISSRGSDQEYNHFSNEGFDRVREPRDFHAEFHARFPEE